MVEITYNYTGRAPIWVAEFDTMAEANAVAAEIDRQLDLLWARERMRQVSAA